MLVFITHVRSSKEDGFLFVFFSPIHDSHVFAPCVCGDLFGWVLRGSEVATGNEWL